MHTRIFTLQSIFYNIHVIGIIALLNKFACIFEVNIDIVCIICLFTFFEVLSVYLPYSLSIFLSPKPTVQFSIGPLRSPDYMVFYLHVALYTSSPHTSLFKHVSIQLHHIVLTIIF